MQLAWKCNWHTAVNLKSIYERVRGFGAAKLGGDSTKKKERVLIAHEEHNNPKKIIKLRVLRALRG